MHDMLEDTFFSRGQEYQEYLHSILKLLGETCRRCLKQNCLVMARLHCESSTKGVGVRALGTLALLKGLYRAPSRGKGLSCCLVLCKGTLMMGCWMGIGKERRHEGG